MEKCMTNPKSEGYISSKDMAGRAAYYKVLQAAKNGELTRIKRGVYATKADTLNVFRLFALPVEALKLPSVATVELSTHIICGGVW